MQINTQKLLEQLKKSNEYQKFHNENQNEMIKEYMPVNRALSCVITKRNLKKSQVIAKSGLEPHYAYQILSGTKIPTRDKVIMICIGLEIELDEVQELLKITGYNQLYAKHERDNVIIFGICKKQSIIEINNLLFDLNLDILS